MGHDGPLHVLRHPLVQRDLGLLRAQTTAAEPFRGAIRRVARALAMHALADLGVREVRVDTPLEPAAAAEIAETVALVPVLRAGLGLVDGFLDVLPEARVCHLGLVRDEDTLRPACYLSKLDSIGPDERVFVLDPMLATGGSAIAALDRLASRGLRRPPGFVCVLAAPQGLERLHAAHPEVPVLAAAVDREADARGWIRPGLGDAGDRLFGA